MNSEQQGKVSREVEVDCVSAQAIKMKMLLCCSHLSSGLHINAICTDVKLMQIGSAKSICLVLQDRFWFWQQAYEIWTPPPCHHLLPTCLCSIMSPHSLKSKLAIKTYLRDKEQGL